MESNLQQVNIHQLKEKIGSKKELYDFLTQECAAYLPKLNCTNVYFFRDIIDGKKEYLKRNNVVLSAVPQIEGLTCDDFLAFTEGRPELLKYLPSQCDWLHLDKRWLCDVLLSLDQEGVLQMIQDAKLKRREKLDQSQNMIVHMKPEFVNALQNSLNFSVHKGRSAYLMKQSAKRKSRQQPDEEMKGDDISQQPAKRKYLDENKRIKDEVNQMKDEIGDLINYKNLVMQLHDQGIIDGEGKPQNIEGQQQNNNFMI